MPGYPPPFIGHHEEEQVAQDDNFFRDVLKACHPLRDHYMYIQASKRPYGVAGFVYVNWHWIKSSRVSDADWHANIVSQLLQNLPENKIKSAQRSWKMSPALSSLPSYIDTLVAGMPKRVLLLHRKVGL